MSIDCEIWTRSVSFGSLNARFTVLPRIGELIKVSIHGITQEQFVVTSIVHIDLDLHGNDARPSVQLWVENATRPDQ